MLGASSLLQWIDDASSRSYASQENGVSASEDGYNIAYVCADGNGFVTVVSDDHLATIRVTPFLMTALLTNFLETAAPQDTNDIVRVADGITLTH